ncbi:MAG TPA: hypothetical protein VGG51_12150 [Candidatus Cybelea sp.]|jgi:hypothetical protein
MTLRIVRYAFAACLAAVPITGCGAGGSSGAAMPAAPAAMRPHSNVAHFASAGSWFRHDSGSSGDLVYMADGENIDIYSFAGKQVGQLKGFRSTAVYGLCSDPDGNVWVTYGGSLLEYARGGTVPIAQFYTDETAVSCAVDPTTGDIAVSEGTGEGRIGVGNEVAVYTDIYASPEIYRDSDVNYYLFTTYDSDGNLFVDGSSNIQRNTALVELPQGGSALQTVKMDEKFGKVGGLQWDSQYVAIGDSEKQLIYEMSIADGSATTVGTTRLHAWRGARFKDIEPFAIGNGQIVLTFSDRQTGFWRFPGGGKTLHRISVITGAKTISVAPSGLRRTNI